jgi:PAS domain S-box-containing protein
MAEREGVRPDQRFRAALVEHAADAVVVLAADGTIMFANPVVEHMLGYRVDELTGTSAFSLLHPDDLAPSRDMFGSMVAGGGATGALEFRVRCKDGEWRWLEVTATNRLQDDAVRGIVAVYRNVTERRRLAEEREARVRLDGALLMAHTVAHQINNSLCPVVGYAELLGLRESVRRDPAAAGQVELIARAASEAQEQVARLQRIVRLEPDASLVGSGFDVLDVARSSEQARAELPDHLAAA